jgi:hypothetical protein
VLRRQLETAPAKPRPISAPDNESQRAPAVSMVRPASRNGRHPFTSPVVDLLGIDWDHGFLLLVGRPAVNRAPLPQPLPQGPGIVGL